MRGAGFSPLSSISQISKTSAPRPVTNAMAPFAAWATAGVGVRSPPPRREHDTTKLTSWILRIGRDRPYTLEPDSPARQGAPFPTELTPPSPVGFGPDLPFPSADA